MASGYTLPNLPVCMVCQRNKSTALRSKRPHVGSSWTTSPALCRAPLGLWHFFAGNVMYSHLISYLMVSIKHTFVVLNYMTILFLDSLEFTLFHVENRCEDQLLCLVQTPRRMISTSSSSNGTPPMKQPTS
jgi:hypothetical protein